MPHKKIHMHLQKVPEPNPRFRFLEGFSATFPAPQMDSLCHQPNPGKFLQLFMARRRSVGNSNNFFTLCGTRGARGYIGGARRALKLARNAFPRAGEIHRPCHFGQVDPCQDPRPRKPGWDYFCYCLWLAIAPLGIPTIFLRFVGRAERVDALPARGAR